MLTLKSAKFTLEIFKNYTYQIIKCSANFSHWAEYFDFGSWFGDKPSFNNDKESMYGNIECSSPEMSKKW